MSYDYDELVRERDEARAQATRIFDVLAVKEAQAAVMRTALESLQDQPLLGHVRGGRAQRGDGEDEHRPRHRRRQGSMCDV